MAETATCISQTKRRGDPAEKPKYGPQPPQNDAYPPKIRSFSTKKFLQSSILPGHQFGELEGGTLGDNALFFSIRPEITFSPETCEFFSVKIPAEFCSPRSPIWGTGGGERWVPMNFYCPPSLILPLVHQKFESKNFRQSSVPPGHQFGAREGGTTCNKVIFFSVEFRIQKVY